MVANPVGERLPPDPVSDAIDRVLHAPLEPQRAHPRGMRELGRIHPAKDQVPDLELFRQQPADRLLG